MDGNKYKLIPINGLKFLTSMFDVLEEIPGGPEKVRRAHSHAEGALWRALRVCDEV